MDRGVDGRARIAAEQAAELALDLRPKRRVQLVPQEHRLGRAHAREIAGMRIAPVGQPERLRRSGIGKMLFDAVAREAKEVGAKRFKWQVLDWNEPAIAFYKKIGANLDSEWINCNMTEEQLKAYTPD